jgi:hypothetical protein
MGTVKQADAAFEQEKWHDDVRLRELEIDIRAREQQSHEADSLSKRKNSNGPVGQIRWCLPYLVRH